MSSKKYKLPVKYSYEYIAQSAAVLNWIAAFFNSANSSIFTFDSSQKYIFTYSCVHSLQQARGVFFTNKTDKPLEYSRVLKNEWQCYIAKYP